MYICHYIESYHSREGQRVSVFHRGEYLYELAAGARHIRWFNDMSLDDVRAELAATGFTIINVEECV